MSQPEGDSGATAFSFTVTLSAGVSGGFTIPYSTSDGSATTLGGDYTAASGTLTFAGTGGETQTVTISVNGDTVFEPDETFTVELGTPSNASVSVSDGSGLGTIENDESPSIAIDDVSQPEGDSGTTGFIFTVTLTGEVPGGFTVPYSTSDGSATTADDDYTAASGTLSFAGTDGETETVTISVNGDTVFEPDETFTVLLGTPSSGTVAVSDGTGLGTLENDDVQPDEIFADGFESGTTDAWSATVPPGFIAFAALSAAEGASVGFAYDFAALVGMESLAPAAVAMAVDAQGGVVFTVEAQREGVGGQLELRLVARGGQTPRRSAWEPVVERGQDLLLEWQLDGEQPSTLALWLDGRLALWLDGFDAAAGSPAVLQLFRPARH